MPVSSFQKRRFGTILATKTLGSTAEGPYVEGAMQQHLSPKEVCMQSQVFFLVFAGVLIGIPACGDGGSGGSTRNGDDGGAAKDASGQDTGTNGNTNVNGNDGGAARDATARDAGTNGNDRIFVDGPGGDVDTGQDLLISSNWATRNGGQHASFQLEGLPGTIQHALLKFDLSSLSSSDTCTRATLYLYHDYDSEGSGLNTGKVYSVSAANWPWTEGSGDIDIALQGEPCWNAREADGQEGVQTPWAGSVGCSTAGVDYEATPIGSWSFDASLPKGAEIAIELDTNRVQEWFGGSNTNYGIILVADDNVHSAHVGSAENATAGYRPKLVVHYR